MVVIAAAVEMFLDSALSVLVTPRFGMRHRAGYCHVVTDTGVVF
jgi:hypothetical protein